MRDQANVAHPKVWTFDKSIPLALIVTLFVGAMGQGAATIWWASNLSTRTEAQERLLASVVAQQLSMQSAAQDRADRTATTLQSISEKTIRLEVGMDALRSIVEQVARNVASGNTPSPN
jgi:hypothetical protein